MSVDNTRSTLINWLQEAHAMVEHGETMMSGRADALEAYPKLRDKLRAHVAETRHHGADIKSAIERLGAHTSAAKDIGGKLSALGHSWGTRLSGETAVQSVAASLAFEHFEIANFRAMITAADQAGEAEVRATLESIMRENEAMAHWLSENLLDTTRQYLAKAPAD
ncbi:DUF892 family protein [Salinisphaera sp. SPP-AMP-43]|uniref:DUF892 family protein n=1 Tax=Salinisphaera sp. SPP-AMP-43 TaxID=3121288 RepID=UPI003C6E9028